MRFPGAHDRVTSRLLWSYWILAAATMSVSARLWFADPLPLIEHEFDFFVGLFTGPGSEAAIARGRGLHFLLFVALGLLFAGIAGHVSQVSTRWSDRAVAGYGGLMAVTFMAGMPWVSPDVFFYIGTGWAEAHYGLDPYRYAMSQVPAFQSDPMFGNVYPAFMHGNTSYGPAFQKLAAGLAGLSGGSEKLALLLHKLLGLALHAAASAMVYRLAAPGWRRLALFGYAANPLILFSVLTCAHNDHLMNVFVLVALCLLQRQQAWSAGLALGAAFSLKYFPLVFLPILLVTALLQNGRGAPARPTLADLRRAAALGLGFLAAALALQQLYPTVEGRVGNLVSTGVGVYRNSVFHLFDVLTQHLLPAVSGLPPALIVREDFAGVLRLIYTAVYLLMLWRCLPRWRVAPFQVGVELCLKATLLYFVLVNTSNQEWYLTWLMGFALILPGDASRLLALRLSVVFVPLVIYTVVGPRPTVLWANAALYGLLLVCAGLYLRRQRNECAATPRVP